MKKAIIPMAIAAAFGLAGMIVYSVGTYVPATVNIEGDGGTDEKVENLDDASGAFSVPALSRGASYYQGLMQMDEDPEPLPEGNSIGVHCVGNYSNTATRTSYDRELIIAQNEKGLMYRYNGWQIVSGNKTTLDYLVAVSRFGMFVKYNSHSIVSTTDQELDPLQIDLSAAMNNNRGKWFKVEVSEKHMKEATETSNPMRAMVIGTCASVAAQYQSQFLNVVETNNGQIKELGQLIETEKSSATKEGNVYKISKSNLNADVNLSSPAAPLVILYGSSNSETQRQNIVLEHINNTKVEIIKSASGDFVDLFGKAITNYINKSM